MPLGGGHLNSAEIAHELGIGRLFQRLPMDARVRSPMQTLQILSVAVLPILVLVVNLEATRNWLYLDRPDLPMQKPSPALEIAVLVQLPSPAVVVSCDHVSEYIRQRTRRQQSHRRTL